MATVGGVLAEEAGNTPRPAPLIPLQRPSLGPEELDAVSRVFASRWLGMGAEVERFEREIGDFCGASRVVATSSGTAALHLALKSLAIEPGAEVIVPSLTFVATLQAIVAAGLTPVFADIDPVSLNVCAESIRRCRSPRTRAILPIHYRGSPCAMADILAFAQEEGLFVVEDAAHAFGSRQGGSRIGAAGQVVCFSFDPIKNITCGEGGAIVYPDPRLDGAFRKARRMRILGVDTDTWTRVRDQQVRYSVAEEGFRYHMADVNAAIGCVQLGRFEAFARRRREIAQAYDAAFRGVARLEVIPTDYEDAVPFMYVLKVQERDRFIARLRADGVSSGIHYIPNHYHELFRDCPRDDLRHTEEQGARIVTLPLFTEQTEVQVRAVIAAVLAAA